MLILLHPARIALALGAAKGALLDRVLANGISDHLGSLLVGGGEIDLVAEIEQKTSAFSRLPIGGMYDVGD